MTLPAGWRRLTDERLEDLVNSPASDDADVDDILDELAERDAQAGANRGEMNGVPPEYDVDQYAVDDRLPEP